MTQILLAPASDGTAILRSASNSLVSTTRALTVNSLRSGGAFTGRAQREGLGQNAYSQGITFLLASKPFQSRYSGAATQYLLMAALGSETAGLMLNVYA